ncbi:MAG: hypothetical protein JJU48_01665 [Methylophaga sp.]|nr:hypothetical protein [Methylophaga sp.]
MSVIEGLIALAFKCVEGLYWGSLEVLCKHYLLSITVLMVMLPKLGEYGALFLGHIDFVFVFSSIRLFQIG